MTINYNDILTIEQKVEILTKRINSFAVEAYTLSMNLKVIENEQEIARQSSQLAELEKAIAVHQEEITKLTE
jgi:hypothetical protein